MLFELRDSSAVRLAVGDDAVKCLSVLGADVGLVDILAEKAFERAASTARYALLGGALPNVRIVTADTCILKNTC